jgi:N-succinyldiaminopimelate aminotransferase
MPTPARRVAPFGTTVFTEINALARQHNAVNLGQGMPDFDGPAAAIEAAVTALRSGANQYAPGPGIETLRRGIAAHALRFYDLEIDPADGVLVTPGATEAVLWAWLTPVMR